MRPGFLKSGWALALVCLVGRLALADAAERGTARDRWQMPGEVVSTLGLRTGVVVADIGAGAGYFTMPFARAVGPHGRVYAVDIDAHALEYVKKEAATQNLSNIETIVSRKDDPLLRRSSIDLAFFCDTVHEIADRPSFYRKVRQTLKKGGRMAVIHWIPANSAGGGGSPDSDRQVSREATLRETAAAGFRLVKEPKFLPQQYFLIFERAARDGARDKALPGREPSKP